MVADMGFLEEWLWTGVWAVRDDALRLEDYGRSTILPSTCNRRRLRQRSRPAIHAAPRLASCSLGAWPGEQRPSAWGECTSWRQSPGRASRMSLATRVGPYRASRRQWVSPGQPHARQQQSVSLQNQSQCRAICRNVQVNHVIQCAKCQATHTRRAGDVAQGFNTSRRFNQARLTWRVASGNCAQRLSGARLHISATSPCRVESGATAFRSSTCHGVLVSLMRTRRVRSRAAAD
jgi:hypothetical protein